MLGLVLPSWAKWAALAVLALALYGFGRMDGARIEGAKHAEYVAQQAAQAVRIIRAQEKVVVQTEIRYRDRIKVIKEKGDVIVKQVPIYVTSDDDAGCRVSVGFVRAHRAATTGEPAGAADDSDREASGVALSTVAETDAENARNHRACIVRVEGWQEYYRDLKEASAN
jgi:hypothetical protein